MKSFLTALSFGFMIGTIGILYFMGPSKIREQVCQGYSGNEKPLSLSRKEKETYIEKFKIEHDANEKNLKRDLSSQEREIPKLAPAKTTISRSSKSKMKDSKKNVSATITPQRK